MGKGSNFDVIVIGGGSAGCLAAGRLVAEYGLRVLLLEQGGADRSPLIHMPAGFVELLGNQRYMTFHRGARQAQLFDREPFIPQGRVLGGGSSVNAMVYVRGQAEDYQEWVAATGDQGWRFSSLLPHFINMEANGTFNNRFHGIDGPLSVTHGSSVCDVSRAFVLAAQEAGLPYNEDFNGETQAGVGFYQITAGGGRRCSAVDAFLAPVRKDSRLTIRTGARVHRILIENGVAKGVLYRQGGALKKAWSDEVICTAGALVTPQLLMLSGIGDAAELEKNGIGVVAESPGVGRNLQDHHEAPVLAFCNGKYGYYKQDSGFNRLRNGARYLAFRDGPVSSNGVEAGAFINPDDAGGRPTLQIFCVPTVYLDPDVTDQKPTYGFTLNSCVLRPRSRGSVTLRSSSPEDLPLISPNYLDDAEDLRLSIAGIRSAAKIAEANPLKNMVERVVYPESLEASDEVLAEHCRRTAKTVYHPVGTCRMGRMDDPMAVLDSQLRVKGVQGLRVFDASSWPNIISGNTNATVYAVADRGVSMMMGDIKTTEDRQTVDGGPADGGSVGLAAGQRP